MLFSEERGFVFISVPKTGTTSIEAHLQKIDPQIVSNKLRDDRGKWVNATKHVTATTIRHVLGKSARRFQFIAFLRDPRELVISKYNWYRNGWPYEKLKCGELRWFYSNRNWWRPTLAHRVTLARVMPLKAWARLYPFKPSYYFVTDRRGRLSVNHLGLFETLQNDFSRIFRKFGYSSDELELPRSNLATYEDYRFSRTVLNSVAKRRAALDLELIANEKRRRRISSTQ